MDTIIVVSPGYLDAVKVCLNRYTNFCIAGYTEVSRALEALNRIPGINILGVAYFNNNIREGDDEGLQLLMNKVNIIFQDIHDEKGKNISVPFIYLLSMKQGGERASSNYVRSLTQGIGTNNLKIGYYNFEIATDTVIKVHMFGTILLKRRPFEVTHPEISDTFNNPDHLHIELPFDKKYIDIYAPLTYIERDEYMLNYQKERLLCLIRAYMYTESENLMTEILQGIEKLPMVSKIPYESILRNLELVKR